MKLLITILSFLTLTTCSPEGNLQKVETPNLFPPEQPKEPDLEKNNTMKITIGNTPFTATIATNATVTAFKVLLPLTLTMSDFNNNEKVASLPQNLTTTATPPGTIQTGDIMLYGSSSLVLFYETFPSSYKYTKIGRIDNTLGLKTALGKGNVTIKFEKNGD